MKSPPERICAYTVFLRAIPTEQNVSAQASRKLNARFTRFLHRLGARYAAVCAYLQKMVSIIAYRILAYPCDARFAIRAAPCRREILRDTPVHFATP